MSTYWTHWDDVPNSTECDYNWWCWGKDRKATYHWQSRKKMKNGRVIKTESRRVKDHCGCD